MSCCKKISLAFSKSVNDFHSLKFALQNDSYYLLTYIYRKLKNKRKNFANKEYNFSYPFLKVNCKTPSAHSNTGSKKLLRAYRPYEMVGKYMQQNLETFQRTH